MKKLIQTLSLLVTVVAGALAQNDAVYVYRNDGKFNAFFKSEIKGKHTNSPFFHKKPASRAFL